MFGRKDKEPTTPADQVPDTPKAVTPEVTEATDTAEDVTSSPVGGETPILPDPDTEASAPPHVAVPDAMPIFKDGQVEIFISKSTYDPANKGKEIYRAFRDGQPDGGGDYSAKVCYDAHCQGYARFHDHDTPQARIQRYSHIAVAKAYAHQNQLPYSDQPDQHTAGFQKSKD